MLVAMASPAGRGRAADGLAMAMASAAGLVCFPLAAPATTPRPPFTLFTNTVDILEYVKLKLRKSPGRSGGGNVQP